MKWLWCREGNNGFIFASKRGLHRCSGVHLADRDGASRRGAARFPESAIIRIGRNRALVVSFGFVPIQRPLAIVIIGGVLSSTFLNLVLLPVLYEWVEKTGRVTVLNENKLPDE